MTLAFELNDFSVYLESPSGRVCLVDAISIDVRRGETVCVVGESGSGKSVALLSSIRLLEYTAPVTFEGEVLLGEQNLLDLGQREMTRIRGNRIGVIFQEAMDALNPTQTIRSQLVEAHRLNVGVGRRGSPGAMDPLRKAISLLEEVGIHEPETVLKSYPHQLSGGMQQRVMIAMALMGDPEVLIADEPTTALDVTIQADILRLLQRIQRERSMACIFVTHDMAVAATIASRIFVLYAGQVIESGPARSILTSPKHAYTKALLECIPKANTRFEGRMPTIRGAVPAPGSWPAGERFSPRNPLASDRSFSEPPPVSYSEGGAHMVRSWTPVETWTPELTAKLTGVQPVREQQPSRAVPSAEPVIELADVSKTYGRRSSRAVKRAAVERENERAPRRAVDGLDLTIFGNELFGIVGESGSGKSTLAKLILDLERPDPGSAITIQGRDITRNRSRADELAFRENIQMVFQNPLDTLNPRRSIEQSICEPLVNLQGMEQSSARVRAKELIDAVGLPSSYLGKHPNDLSGGQRQRIAIARALAPHPRIIVADEPTSALDVSVQAQIINLLLDLQLEFDLTLVMITHNLSLITSIADRIGVMYRGELVETLDGERLLSGEFAHPYTRRLLEANPAPELLERKAAR